MQFGFGRPWTPMVRNLIIVTGAIFLLQTFDRSGLPLEYLALDSAEVFDRLRLWQPLTYLFLHGGPLHLFFNLFALWMFGSELEEYLGPREFLFYYLFCGVGAGFLVVGLDARWGARASPSAPRGRSTACCSPTACSGPAGRSRCSSSWSCR